MGVQKNAQKYQWKNKQPILPIDNTRKKRYQKSARKIREHIGPETIQAKKISDKTTKKRVDNEIFSIQAMEESIYDYDREKRVKKIKGHAPQRRQSEF